MTEELTGRTFEFEAGSDFDLVWQALTTPEGLASWYGVDAEIEGEIGGRMVIDFGAGPIGMGIIEEIEPGKKLRLVYDNDEWPGIEEWLIENRDGVTHVRLVHSLHVADGDTWDGTYPGIVRGWSLFMGTMQFVAQRVGKVGRRSEVRLGSIAAGAWTRVLESLGLGSTPAKGQSVEIAANNAEVLVSVDGYSLLLAIGDEATLLIDVEGDSLYTVAATYGDDSPVLTRLRDQLTSIAELACEAAGQS